MRAYVCPLGILVWRRDGQGLEVGRAREVRRAGVWRRGRGILREAVFRCWDTGGEGRVSTLRGG